MKDELISTALARRVVPSLFAHKVVGVQPMAAPVGMAYATRMSSLNSLSEQQRELINTAALNNIEIFKAIEKCLTLSGLDLTRSNIQSVLITLSQEEAEFILKLIKKTTIEKLRKA
jgi:hypothetical protein